MVNYSSSRKVARRFSSSVCNINSWYTRALKIVEALAPDRLDEFVSYYLPDPKRERLDAMAYRIQDFVRGVAHLLVVTVLLISFGCAPMMVVMGDPLSAEVGRFKYGYFKATRMDVSTIGVVWQDEKILLPGKVMGTAIFAADVPLSLAFDLLFDGPVNLMHGNPKWPWQQVELFRWDSACIRVGMSKEQVRAELVEADAPEPQILMENVWRLDLEVEDVRQVTWPAIIEVYFRGERVDHILEYIGVE